MAEPKQKTDFSTLIPGALEIIGFFVVLAGCGAVTYAAGMVSTPLAVLVAGALAVLWGVLVIYAAVAIERARPGGKP